jgi:hypothetical protein
VVHACNPNTWEAKAGGSQVQGQPGLHNKFKDNCIARLSAKKQNYNEIVKT